MGRGLALVCSRGVCVFELGRVGRQELGVLPRVTVALECASC